MDDIPATLNYVEPKKEKPWNYRKKPFYIRGTGLGGLTIKDNVLASLKSTLNTYPSMSGAESLAKSVVGMVGIENMNIDFLAAALYLYNVYHEDFPDENMLDGIKAEMFEDNTATMKKIKEKLDKIARVSSEKSDEWIKRKINILAYLKGVLTYLSRSHLDFIPSQAYMEKEVKRGKMEKEEEEEAEQEVEDDEEETGNIDEDSDFDAPDEGDEDEDDMEVVKKQAEETDDD